MVEAYLEYQLQHGYIDHWLVAGPQAITVPDLDQFEGDDFKRQIARAYAEQHAAPDMKDPIEHDSLILGEATLSWRYVRCLDDHFVDLTET